MTNLPWTSSLDYYRWLSGLAWSRKLGLSLLMAGITAESNGYGGIPFYPI